MARAPNSKKEETKKLQEKAKKMYDAGMKLVEIAKEIGRPEGTVRRWKSELGWDGKKANVRKGKNERSEKTKMQQDSEGEEGHEPEDEKNSALDGKQEKFCLYYSRTFNATDAYQWAYGCSRESAGAAGSRLLKNVKVQQEIKRLKTGALTRAMLEADDIVERYIKIAFADIGAYIDRVADNEVIFRDLKETDTSLIQEVKNTKYGTSVKLIDSGKALRWLADHYDLLTQEQQARVAMLQNKASQSAADERETGVVMLQEAEDG